MDNKPKESVVMFHFKTSQTELQPIGPHNPEARWVPKEEVSELLTAKEDGEFFESIVHEI